MRSLVDRELYDNDVTCNAKQHCVWKNLTICHAFSGDLWNINCDIWARLRRTSSASNKVKQGIEIVLADTRALNFTLIPAALTQFVVVRNRLATYFMVSTQRSLRQTLQMIPLSKTSRRNYSPASHKIAQLLCLVYKGWIPISSMRRRWSDIKI